MSERVRQSDPDGSLCDECRAGGVCEDCLPAPMREALRLARDVRPQHRLRCLAFDSTENGREVAHMGLTSVAGLHPKEVLVIVVAVTETAAEDVRTLNHRLVVRIEEARGAPQPLGSAVRRADRFQVFD